MLKLIAAALLAAISMPAAAFNFAVWADVTSGIVENPLADPVLTHVGITKIQFYGNDLRAFHGGADNPILPGGCFGCFEAVTTGNKLTIQYGPAYFLFGSHDLNLVFDRTLNADLSNLGEAVFVSGSLYSSTTGRYLPIYLAFGPIVSFSAVPEPASWAMMIGGFALAGGALRRTRKAAFA